MASINPEDGSVGEPEPIGAHHSINLVISMNLDLDRVRRLDGANVLVKPAHPEDPNSVGLRGTVCVHDLPNEPGVVRVEIVLDYPERGDMNGPPAHEEVIRLSQADVGRLLAGELGGTGTYEFTLPGDDRTVPDHPGVVS